MSIPTEAQREDADFRELADGPAMNGASAGTRNSWKPIPLGPILEGLLSGAIVGPAPTLMKRTDGIPLLYRGEVHSFAGEPESGKSWIALAECTRAIRDDDPVLYLDFEDNPASVIGRLLTLGATPRAILDSFTYIRPDTPSPDGGIAALARADSVLVVVDGLSEAYVLEGLDPEKNVDAAKFLALLPRPIAAAGSAVILIDHVTKAREGRGRWAIGAQHKLAGIAVAYSFEAVKPFSRAQSGLVKIRVEKDRHGHVRGHAQGGVIALAHVDPSDEGNQVSVTLAPPDSATDEGEFRPTELMERASAFLEVSPDATLNQIRDGVTGKAEWVTAAVRCLVAEGHVEQRQDGQALRHSNVRRFTGQDPPSPRVPTESQPSPGTGSSTGSPSPPPEGDSDPAAPPENPQPSPNSMPRRGASW